MTVATISHVPSPPPAAVSVPQAAAPPGRPFVEVLQEQNAPRPAPARPAPPPAAPPATPPVSPAREIMQGALDADHRMDAALRAAASGRTFSPAELLALQAQVFRYSQTVEVISRGTDKVVAGVKQTLGTQV